MDLIPKPDQVVSAASNLAHRVFYGGLADLRPMPRTLIDEGTLREIYHYRPARRASVSGDPVLLVTPLAAPSMCFDLRRGCSLVEHLVQAGRPTYLVEYGEVSFRDRALGMEHWIDEVIPTAVNEVSDHAGGRPVHLVGWSLGAIFALLTAADRLDLPIASITSMGAPVDVSQVPMVAPLRPLLHLSDGRGVITRTYQSVGGAPKPLVRWVFQLTSLQKLVTKPLALVANMDDKEFLAQLEAVDQFTQNMMAYPGRTFGQLYHRFLKGNDLVDGRFDLGGRTIDLASITAPVLVVAGSTDGIAPVASVKAVTHLLCSARDVQFEVVPGGHLGMVTGRASRGTTWRALEEWLDHWASDPEVAVAARRQRLQPGRAGRRGSARDRAASPGTESTSAVTAASTRKRTGKQTAGKQTAGTRTAGKQTAGKRAPSKQTASKKTASKRTTSKRTAATAKAATPTTGRTKQTGSKTARAAVKKQTRSKAAPAAADGATTKPTIGANPERRYRSSGSRALSS